MKKLNIALIVLTVAIALSAGLGPGLLQCRHRIEQRAYNSCVCATQYAAEPDGILSAQEAVDASTFIHAQPRLAFNQAFRTF